MRDLILNTVADVAEVLGLERDRVMTESLKDNITLSRPRIEIQYVSETYERTGRFLAATRTGQTMDLKKELYEIKVLSIAHILAEDETWLKAFSADLVAKLPKDLIDTNGNYVRLLATEGTWEGFEKRRVGAAVIDPIPKRGKLIHLTATGRLTETEVARLLKVNFELTSKFQPQNYPK